MTTLVERLRSMARAEHDDLSIGGEAADEIERLQTLADERLEQMRLDRAQALRWRDDLEAIKAERDELASAFIVLWISQDAAERTHWDAKAVERFDALLAKLGADKTGGV